MTHIQDANHFWTLHGRELAAAKNAIDGSARLSHIERADLYGQRAAEIDAAAFQTEAGVEIRTSELYAA